VTYVKSIEQEAAALFPKGKAYEGRKQLRDDIQEFADRKGFFCRHGWYQDLLQQVKSIAFSEDSKRE
jgi:hypothetical protein